MASQVTISFIEAYASVKTRYFSLIVSPVKKVQGSIVRPHEKRTQALRTETYPVVNFRKDAHLEKESINPL